ncbi:mechanosensitive ion channel family protein [Cellulosimicrobium marinum]|uniref:mechanosensitive ion channel family protein n=1 Tax=Cellulosimicrobium marinum TaxID=1638992 RepID=UPI001E50A197|nr:mechanosensitive ion channel family protein [Cellulosimicrobium marinum]MCB7135205.1 mechanosensitive ion channel family protein [Cellulosimicrobium marinum]
MEPEIENATDIVVTLAAAAGGLVVAFLLGTVLSAVVGRIGRRSELVRDLSRRLRRPDRALLMVVAVWIAVRVTTDAATPWLPLVEHLLLIALICVAAWWVGAFAFVLEDSALQRYRVDTTDNRHARRVRTQITVIRRLTVAIIVVCAIAGVLLTFPEARAAGASLLASAGLISIVAGLAAQTSLASVFAGMQIAFTDAIRVDDVVVLEGEWGRIEEITMTYVVVHLWDDRRLIMPSTYFTTTPFQNWTRRAADLLGTVELDLDFEVPVGPMRAELKRLLALTDLWDERVGILQVTDAVGGLVRVRALVSAHDAPTLFDLRCFVREGLVDWLQRAAPQGLPRTRFEGAVDGPDDARSAPAVGSAPAGAGVHDGAARDDAASRGFPDDESDRADDEPPVAPARPPRLPPDRGARRADAPVVLGTLRRAGGAGAAPSDDPTRLVGVVPGPEDDGGTTVLPAVGPDAGEHLEAAESAFFSGSAEGEQRSRAFAGPGQDVIDERERTAEHDLVDDEQHATGSTGTAEAGDAGEPGSAHDAGAEGREPPARER